METRQWWRDDGGPMWIPYDDSMGPPPVAPPVKQWPVLRPARSAESIRKDRRPASRGAVKRALRRRDRDQAEAIGLLADRLATVESALRELQESGGRK